MDQQEGHNQKGFTVDWAGIQITQAVSLQNSILEEHSALYRWLLGARLAANGGAAIAVAGLDALSLLAKLIAISIFSLGVILSILSAEFDQIALQKGLLPNLRMQAFWVKFKGTGVYDVAAMDEIIAQSRLVARSNLRGRISGWLSLLLFACGIAVAGVSEVCAPTRANSVQNGKMTDNPILTPQRRPDDADAALRPKTLAGRSDEADQGRLAARPSALILLP